jgi:hypothetical protein
MSKDVSKKTVALLLIIAIAVSAIGTWVMMSKAPEIIDLTPKSQGGSTAQISLNIEDTAIPSGESQISLTILPNGG